MKSTQSVTRRLAAAGVACAVVGLSACATIIHGTEQDVGISSIPTGAKITIDNSERGTTPLVAKLSRKDNHIVRIELPGYQVYETTLTRSTSGWVWGNIAFGGLVGLAVDAMTGGLYQLSPEQVSAALNNGHASLSTGTDGIYVFAALKPDPGWGKVGQLQRLSNRS